MRTFQVRRKQTCDKAYLQHDGPTYFLGYLRKEKERTDKSILIQFTPIRKKTNVRTGGRAANVTPMTTATRRLQ